MKDLCKLYAKMFVLGQGDNKGIVGIMFTIFLGLFIAFTVGGLFNSTLLGFLSWAGSTTGLMIAYVVGVNDE